MFVRPVKNPSLSDYIVQLTGITDALLEQRGVPFAEGLARFSEFAADAPILANGGDGGVLRENCLLNAIPFPFEAGRVVTIRSALERAIGRPSSELVSAELPALLGIGPPPDQHGALADARAIGSCLAWLRGRGRI